MQSILQYRRMRAAVEQDLAVGRKIPGRTNSPTNTTISQSDHEAHGAQGGGDVEKEKERPSPEVPGVIISRPTEHDGSATFLVSFKENDPLNPQNWSLWQKWACTGAICLLCIAITIPSSIDAPVSEEFNEYYGVNAMAGSMTTGMFLLGTAFGGLVAGTISETFGRNIMYMTTFVVFMLFIMAKALAPDFGSALFFRFMTGFFGSTPMTAAGGSIADIWSPLEMVFSMPFLGMTSYAGPILGPIIGAYLPQIGFRWADWISLIIAGVVLVWMLLFQPETYKPVLLEWRAEHLRQLTGDTRYQVSGHATADTLGRRLLTNIYRPFTMTITEPIILIFSLYLTIIYFVLFTFLNGYPYIFQQTYGISLSETYLLWVALLVGDFIGLPLIPLIYKWAKKAAAEGTLTPEICLWYGMLGGSVMLPVSLWWLAWTCYVRLPCITTFFCAFKLTYIHSLVSTYGCQLLARLSSGPAWSPSSSPPFCTRRSSTVIGLRQLCPSWCSLVISFRAP